MAAFNRLSNSSSTSSAVSWSPESVCPATVRSPSTPASQMGIERLSFQWFSSVIGWGEVSATRSAEASAVGSGANERGVSVCPHADDVMASVAMLISNFEEFKQVLFQEVLKDQ